MRTNSGLDGQNKAYFSSFRLNASRTPPGNKSTHSPAARSLYRFLPETGTAPKRENWLRPGPAPPAASARVSAASRADAATASAIPRARVRSSSAPGGGGKPKGISREPSAFFFSSFAAAAPPPPRRLAPPPNPPPPATTGCASPLGRTPRSLMNASMMNPRSGAIVWWFPTSRTGRPSSKGTADKPGTIDPSSRVLKNTGETTDRNAFKLSNATRSSFVDGGTNEGSFESGSGSVTRRGPKPFSRRMRLRSTPASCNAACDAPSSVSTTHEPRGMRRFSLVPSSAEGMSASASETITNTRGGLGLGVPRVRCVGFVEDFAGGYPSDEG